MANEKGTEGNKKNDEKYGNVTAISECVDNPTDTQAPPKKGKIEDPKNIEDWLCNINFDYEEYLGTIEWDTQDNPGNRFTITPWVKKYSKDSKDSKSTKKPKISNKDERFTVEFLLELSSTELARKIGGEVTDAHIRAVTLGREFPKCRVIVMVCGLYGRNLAQWREDCPALEKAITKNMRGRTESFDEYVERLYREHSFTVNTV